MRKTTLIYAVTFFISISIFSITVYGTLQHNWDFNDNLNDTIGTCNFTNSGLTFDTNYPTFAVSGDGSPKSIHADNVADNLISACDLPDAISTICFWADLPTSENGRTLFRYGDVDSNPFMFLWNNAGTFWLSSILFPDVIIGSETLFIGWNSWCLRHNATHIGVYRNASLIVSVSDSDGWVDDMLTKVIAFGDNRGSFGDNDYYIDDLQYYDTSLTVSEMTSLFQTGTITATPSPPSINVTILYPTFNQSFGIQNISDLNSYIYINGTFNTSSSTNCTINDTRFNDTGLTPTTGFNFSFINDSFLDNGFYDVKVMCNLTGTSNGTARALFLIDLENPQITLNPTNAFDTNNLSNVVQYISTMPLNITFTDNRDLFAFMVNVTRGGTTFFNFTNSSIPTPTTNLTYQDSLDTTNWGQGTYDIEIMVSDSHTIGRIQEYGIRRLFNKITFDTEEGNSISISSIGATSTIYIKEKDRYKFGFNYLFSDSARTFILESKNGIHYLKDSSYAAHFVVWNGRGGNWVDFEGIGNKYTVTKINDNKYQVVFTDIPVSKKVILDSIGGLNTVTENYQWYLGNYTKDFNKVATAGAIETFILNVSKQSGFVDTINASFEYNGTQRAISRTETSTSFLFSTTITLPEIQTTFNLSWSVNITQNDSSSYNFTVSDNQSVFLATLTINFLDEENQTAILETLTVFFTLEQTLTVTTATGSVVVGNLTLGEYRISAESENYPNRGIFFTVANQTQNITMYLVIDAVGNDFIDYFIKSSSQTLIEDARMTFQKVINNSLITVAQLETDFAGQGRLFQDQQNEYRILILHPDFPLKNISLLPLRTEYVIILEEALVSLYDNVYEGIRYTLVPKERILNISLAARDIQLDIFADDSSLEWFGLFIDGHNYTCVPVSCRTNITVSPSGGLATVQIFANVTGQFDVHYFYKRVGFDTQFIHGTLYGVVLLEALVGQNVAKVMLGLKNQLGTKNMVTIVAGISNAALAALASQMGIAGIPLILVVVLGTLFFTIIGFIQPIVGVIVVIVGLTVYFVLSRDE